MRPHSLQPTATSPAPRSRLPRIEHCENAITCHLDVRSDWSYELYIVPHWDPSEAVIERFSAPTPALLRQAEVARCLRENGCVVIHHGVALPIHAEA
jgi:hypothetical protein